jgi:DNA repair exonuclease SbcCD ATPase subunit
MDIKKLHIRILVAIFLGLITLVGVASGGFQFLYDVNEDKQDLQEEVYDLKLKIKNYELEEKLAERDLKDSEDLKKQFIKVKEERDEYLAEKDGLDTKVYLLEEEITRLESSNSETRAIRLDLINSRAEIARLNSLIQSQQEYLKVAYKHIKQLRQRVREDSIYIARLENIIYAQANIQLDDLKDLKETLNEEMAKELRKNQAQKAKEIVEHAIDDLQSRLNFGNMTQEEIRRELRYNMVIPVP